MFSRYNRIVGLLTLLTDALLALASFGLAYLLRSSVASPRPLYPLSYYPWIVPLTVGTWLAVGLILGIYRELPEEGQPRAFGDPIKVSIISTLLLFALIFAFKFEYVSRLLLGFYVAFDLVAMIAHRLLARLFGGPLRQALAGFRSYLVVGDSPEALQIARTLETNESRGMRLVGVARLAPVSAAELHDYDSGLQRSYPVHTLSELPELLRRHVIDEVIFAVSRNELEKLEETFLLCEEEGVKTRVLLNFFPHVISKVYLERLRDMPLLTFSTTPENEYLLLV